MGAIACHNSGKTEEVTVLAKLKPSKLKKTTKLNALLLNSTEIFS